MWNLQSKPYVKDFFSCTSAGFSSEFYCTLGFLLVQSLLKLSSQQNQPALR